VFVLKPHSGVPLYRQLYEQVRRLVASGQLTPGTELPSIRELAVTHAVNPMTVSKVYARLESEGVLERNRRRCRSRRGSTRSTPRSKHWCWRRSSSSSAPAT
jgi:DNA-binding transcriptional regulator YhcF (GntR family)